MKRIGLGTVFALLMATLATAGVTFAQTFPEPTGRLVNDFAGLLSPQAEAQLEARLLQLEKDTTDEVTVVTITTLEGEDINDYAVGLFEKWGIGKKGQDNGVLFIMALEERKVRIEVGYGLEPVLTDGRAGRILDNEVVPAFKTGDYEAGIVNGVGAIEDFLRKEQRHPLSMNPVQNLFRPDFLAPILIGLGIFSIYLFGFAARSNSFWLGGVWGVLVGAFLGLATGRVIGLILVTLGVTGFGLFLDWVLSRNYKALKSASKPTSWGNTWGGFGGGYAGGGGGGFHFGGGRSGGGGAGRGW
ncbi:MAG: TPM domain-containing protein [Chloroflexi bacterium]|nr:TPM domain-containing protein [Chloroflexota bacterium]